MLKNTSRFFIFLSLLALPLFGCGDDGAGSGGGGGRSVGEGEAYLRFELSGDVLTSPLVIEGKTEGLRFYHVTTEANILGAVRLEDASGEYSVSQMTFSVENVAVGEGNADDLEFDIVYQGFLSTSGSPTSLSMRPNLETAKFEIESLDRDHMHLTFESEVSPTQLNNKERVFTLKGEIHIRK